MKITTQKRFVAEEFPSEPRSWIARIIQPLNAFIEQMTSALTGGLTLADNIKAKVFTVDIQANQVYPIKMAYTLNERPTACFKGAIHENPFETGSLPVNDFTWILNNNVLELTFSGLNSSKAYRATIIAMV